MRNISVLNGGGWSEDFEATLATSQLDGAFLAQEKIYIHMHGNSDSTIDLTALAPSSSPSLHPCLVLFDNTAASCPRPLAPLTGSCASIFRPCPFTAFMDDIVRPPISSVSVSLSRLQFWHREVLPCRDVGAAASDVVWIRQTPLLQLACWTRDSIDPGTNHGKTT